MRRAPPDAAERRRLIVDRVLVPGATAEYCPTGLGPRVPVRIVRATAKALVVYEALRADTWIALGERRTCSPERLVRS